jgi:putative transposase
MGCVAPPFRVASFLGATVETNGPFPFMTFPRKTIRLPRANYTGKRLYFVTICCSNRQPIFGDVNLVTNCVEMLRACATLTQFAIHAYCFMPDHVHLLMDGQASGSRLVNFVSRFKQLTAFDFRRKSNRSLWQSKYYDHILRSDVAMEDVAWYIWMNPVRKGLSRDPWDYPYSGSFTMPWKKKAPAAECWRPPWKKPTAL